MVTQYKAVTRDIGFEASAKKLKRSPYEVLTVASIIEREVNREEYRAKVARVLYNRLDKGRKLELDSTVIYAEKLKTNTTTPKDRKSKSKYNTYRYKGLPPGPIAAPGQGGNGGRGQPGEGQVAVLRHGQLRHRRDQVRENQAEFKKIRQEFQTWCQANPGRCDS